MQPVLIVVTVTHVLLKELSTTIIFVMLTAPSELITLDPILANNVLNSVIPVYLQQIVQFVSVHIKNSMTHVLMLVPLALTIKTIFVINVNKIVHHVFLILNASHALTHFPFMLTLVSLIAQAQCTLWIIYALIVQLAVFNVFQQITVKFVLHPTCIYGFLIQTLPA